MDYDWITDEGNIIKNIPLSNLPPMMNSGKRTKSELVDTTAKESAKVRTFHSRAFSKKLPISFISPKDWQKYLNFNKAVINNTKGNSLIMKQGGKNGRISRLLNSFHMLYEEYLQIFDNSSPHLHFAGDNPKHSPAYLQDRIRQFSSIGVQCEDIKGSPKSQGEFLAISVQTDITMEQIEQICSKPKTENDVASKKIENLSPISTSLLPWRLRNIINPAKKFGERLKQLSLHHDGKNIFISNSKSFDNIVKLENNIKIEVMEEVHHQSIVCHSLSLVSIDLKKFKLPKMKYLQIPLAIELLLPKIQLKIENILNDCPFLCDPLEVAAELRHFGYDQAACIKYFKITKGLRSIIEEVMPTGNIHINNFVPNAQLVPIRTASLLSINSQLVSNDPSEEPNETLKSLNSNGNHYVAGSNLGKQIVSLEGITKVVGNSGPLSENKISVIMKQNIANRNNSLSIDCITQTSLVHLYMNDKNMESIFYKIKHYLAIIRQLQSETRDEIEYLRKQLCCVFTSLKSHIALLISQGNEKSFSDEQKLKMVTLSKQVDELKLKLKKEEKKRRHAYNLMQEQMGNIRVYCRCRHVADGGSILEFTGNETISLSIAPNERFEFDKVFHPGMSQLDLYEEFRPLVMSFIDGYNVCFITYGGEASGKTFTLIGGNDGSNQQGLMQRALTTILMEERLRQRDCEYRITACVVEIYNDNCNDVLSGETNIQLYVDNGMETAYHKLKSVPITNEADADALMQVCRVKRKVARTALNPSSSRSHLITLIRLQGRSKIHGENICSFLCLCDLAGFEDIIKAETQTNKILSKEAGYINRSLTAFNRVFVSLRKQDPNTVSYRDTKLTHLLKPFLTNSGKCALIITVRNDKRSLGSTQNTLRFGRETRGVSLGKARRQVNLNGQVSVM